MGSGARLFIPHSQKGDSSEHVPTDTEFHSGQPPDGIIAIFQANVFGLVGDDVASFPTTGGLTHIPHIDARQPMRSGTSMSSSIDDTTEIPAFSVGDPR